MRGKVAVGLSGGVDSAAALFFLKKQGYECIGIHLRLADLKEREAEKQIKEAEKVAAQMKVPFYVADERKRFCREVTDYFVKEYLTGRTPNPCVICNEKVRWTALTEFADSMGIPWIATGHYARIERKNGRAALAIPRDRKKDQTYFLYRLHKEQLERTLFPLGDYTKAEIRTLLEKEGIQAAKNPDSQEICFIPDGGRDKWLCESHRFSYVEEEDKKKGFCPGDIVDSAGNVLGRHKGIFFYTVGQRKGLGISAGEPVYIKEIRKKENQIVVGGREGLLTKEVVIERVVRKEKTATGRQPAGDGKDRGGENVLIGYGRLRSSGPLVPCTASRQSEGRWKLEFQQPMWKAGAGQSGVFYQEDQVVLGGIVV